MNTKYAIMGNGVFWDLNFSNTKNSKHSSNNFRKVQNVCDALTSQFLNIKFKIVKIEKVKVAD